MRALVVGLGAIGQRHARNLRTLLGDDLELSALRSGRGGGVVVTERLTIGEGRPEDDCNGGVFTNLDDALAPAPDAVFVCNPTRLHVPVALAAINAGASVFIEKPLADELTGVDDLVAAAQRRNALVAVGCQLRFHPALQRLQSLINDGALGRLIAVHVEQGEYLPAWHPYEDYRQSYAARRDLGGGVVLTQIHELDYVQWLFGLPARVFATGGQLGSLDVDVEDTASALLNCTVAGRNLPVHVHLDYLQRPARRTCRVVGEEGTIAVDLRGPTLTWTDASGGKVEHDDFPGHDRNDMFLAEVADFLECLRSGARPAVGLDHAAGTLRLALAMRQSLENHTLEELPHP